MKTEYDGMINHIAIFDSMLSPEEINSIYTGDIHLSWWDKVKLKIMNILKKVHIRKSIMKTDPIFYLPLSNAFKNDAGTIMFRWFDQDGWHMKEVSQDKQK